MKNRCVAGGALAALALTASSASAEIITLRCTLNFEGEVSVHGVVLDTETRSVRFGGEMHTIEGYSDGDVIRGKVRRFDNERIEFGAFYPDGQSLLYVIDRITGSFNPYATAVRESGSCERTQAAF